MVSKTRATPVLVMRRIPSRGRTLRLRTMAWAMMIRRLGWRDVAWFDLVAGVMAMFALDAVYLETTQWNRSGSETHHSRCRYCRRVGRAILLVFLSSTDLCMPVTMLMLPLALSFVLVMSVRVRM